MKTAMFYGPKDVRIEERERPTAGPGEVVIKSKLALTCGTDVKTYLRGHPLLEPPAALGHEVTGEIVEVGEGVTGFKLGAVVSVHNTAPCGSCYYCKVGNYSLCDSLVHLRGAFSEFVKIPAPVVHTNMFEKPDGMPLKQAALLEPLSCAVYGVAESNIGIGDTVVVNGAGPIGLMMARLSKLRGARVIICDLSASRLEIARELGVNETIDISEVNDQVGAVRSLTENDRGVDVAIEAAGLPEVWEKTIAMTRKGGTVNLFGGCKPGTSIQVDTKLLHYSQLTIKGVFHTTPRYVKKAFNLLRDREINADLFVTGDFALDDIVTALETHAAREGLKNAIHFE